LSLPNPMGTTGRPLRFATFLAPSLFPVYAAICDYLGRELGVPAELVVGRSFDQFERGEVDAGFICGLPYVQLSRQSPSPVELLVAPVLRGRRYGGRPIYLSDVIVRADSPYSSFADLRGCVWSYNDVDSQSGYGVTLYTLAKMGETGGFFGKVVEAGFHQESIRLVREGQVDASAIDSQVLALAMCEDPQLQSSLRVIHSLGPSTIQPVVAARHLPPNLKLRMRKLLVAMWDDMEMRARLHEGLFERFVAVSDSDYDDIREMLRLTEETRVTVLI
jgi:phosphonate transport system substrate-binding protein